MNSSFSENMYESVEITVVTSICNLFPRPFVLFYRDVLVFLNISFREDKKTQVGSNPFFHTFLKIFLFLLPHIQGDSRRRNQNI